MPKSAAPKTAPGELTEEITILTSTRLPVSVTSITRASQTATVTTATPHGFLMGDYVRHAGATQPDYNIEAPITVTSPTTYTFPVSGSPATPATGTITATYVMDSVGGISETFSTLASGVFAKIEALTATERLAMGGISAINSYKVTIYYRPDITPRMRVQWRPFRNTTTKLLEIQGVLPHPSEPRDMLLLTAAEVLT